MFMGVILHSAQVFNPSRSWYITADRTTPIAQFIVEAIHLFRMPAFFAISGFFFSLTFRKYDLSTFMRLRLQRIIVPIVATALTLNLLQSYVLHVTGWKPSSWSKYFLDGGWIAHLWFLITLIALFLICVLGYLLLKAFGVRKVPVMIERITTMPLAMLLFILPVSTVGILGLNSVGFPLYERFMGISTAYEILAYLPYFSFGILLGLRRELLYRIVSVPLYVSAIFVVLAAVGFAAVESLIGESGVIGKLLAPYSKDILVWLSIAFVFSLFYRLFNRKSDFWLFFSDASYTTYLFHHSSVVFLGLAMISIELPPLVSMAIVVVLVTAACLALHKYVISRSPKLHFLFNGK